MDEQKSGGVDCAPLCGYHRRMTADETWLTVHDAAHRTGISVLAMRARINRRTVRSRKDNRGRVWVCLTAGPMHTSSHNDDMRTVTGHSALVHTSPETEPSDLAAALHSISELRVLLERQEHRADAARAAIERRADAEIARLTSIWQERCDAAECRAEQATAALTDLVNRILTTIPAPQPAPLWRTLLG